MTIKKKEYLFAPFFFFITFVPYSFIYDKYPIH